jgi:hypothetical protein
MTARAAASGRIHTKGGKPLAVPIPVPLEHLAGSFGSHRDVRLWIAGTGAAWEPEGPDELGGIEYCLEGLLALYPLSASATDARRPKGANKRPRGRPPGRGLAEPDEPYVAELRKLIASGQYSGPNAAAWQIVRKDGSGVPGNAQPESKVKRLVGRLSENNGE